MAIKVITPATEPLIDIETLRSHCKVDVGDDDELLLSYLSAAVVLAEHYTQRAIGQQTLELALDEFPADGGAIDLSPGPLVSVESVTYVDTDGQLQTLSSTAYTVDDYSFRPWLIVAADTTWPATYAAVNVVKVRFVAGSLPSAVRAALLLLTAHLYKRREAVSEKSLDEVPVGARALLDTVKVWSA